MTYLTSVIKIEQAINKLYEEDGCNLMNFHQFAFIKKTVERISETAVESGLEEIETQNAVIAGWFYYTGKCKEYEEFVPQSQSIAKSILSIQGFNETVIKEIIDLLACGAKDEDQLTLTEKVFLDGINTFLSKSSFQKNHKKWHKERNNYTAPINELNWTEFCHRKLTIQKFYTDHAIRKNSDGLEVNTEWFGKKIKSLSKKRDRTLEKDLQVDEGELKELKKKLQKIVHRPERGVETFFRVSSKNLYTRARIADNKANIMISINALVLSIVLGTFYSKMEEDPHLIYAVITLLFTNLISIGYSILATRPTISKKKFTKEDIKSQSATLMTFDDFQSMSRDDFEWGISQITSNADYLYLNITRDIYNLGMKLSKKYKYLHRSYTVFFVGLTLAITLFIACHLFF